MAVVHADSGRQIPLHSSCDCKRLAEKWEDRPPFSQNGPEVADEPTPHDSLLTNLVMVFVTPN